jgi:hypothetical protein
VLLDAAPCEVVLPDGVTLVRRARVWVTTDEVLVAVEETPGTVRVRHRAVHAAPPEIADPALPRRRRRHVIHTDAGDLVVNPVIGCLCSTPTLRDTTFEETMRSG